MQNFKQVRRPSELPLAVPVLTALFELDGVMIRVKHFFVENREMLRGDTTARQLGVI